MCQVMLVKVMFVNLTAATNASERFFVNQVSSIALFPSQTTKKHVAFIISQNAVQNITVHAEVLVQVYTVI